MKKLYQKTWQAPPSSVCTMTGKINPTLQVLGDTSVSGTLVKVSKTCWLFCLDIVAKIIPKLPYGNWLLWLMELVNSPR